MKIEAVEIWVGIFVVIGITCIGYMTVKLGKMEVFESESYTLKARFYFRIRLKKTGLMLKCPVFVLGGYPECIWSPKSN